MLARLGEKAPAIFASSWQPDFKIKPGNPVENVEKT